VTARLEPARLRSRPSPHGFTLVEIVVVITLTAILAGVVTGFITRPMEAYRDLSLRATLVDEAETALRRLSRDVHAALPNSLRVSPDGRSLEVLHVADGARYRRAPGAGHTAADDWLDFAGDDAFNLVGRFENLAFGYGVPLPAGTRLAIYTTSAAVYADAASDADPGVITPGPTGVTITDDGDEDHVSLSVPFQFRFESPRRRLYVVEGPVSYLCDPGTASLTRYSAYSVASAQPTDPAAIPLSAAQAALVADRVASCAFAYDPGTSSRAGLLTVRLGLAEGAEQVRLLHQVHVDNAP
jgi:MSHA biogenesis protein MshO